MITRSISPAGLSLIKHYEGYRSSIYKDAAGYPTIGYGHLLLDGEDEKFRGGLDENQAEALLKSDVAQAEAAVRDLITVALNQNEFDALVSFTFNLGRKNLAESTLRRRLNAGERRAVAAEMNRWVHAGGRRLNGLVKRRAAEGEMFKHHDIA